jgi:hypothetical protein
MALGPPHGGRLEAQAPLEDGAVCERATDRSSWLPGVAAASAGVLWSATKRHGDGERMAWC